MSHILVRGMPVACAAEVRLWADTGLHFHAKGKRSETRAVVWHHTGGEGGGKRVYDVLMGRGLSVHFLVDQAGVVWQYCDAADYCSHASGANGWSVGVEISNRASPQAAHARWPRDVQIEHIHGRSVVATRFYRAQLDAALHLARSLSAAFGLPMQVPIGGAGDVLTRVLTKQEIASVRGHIGHLHLTERKRDPGVELLREFATRWAVDGHPAE